MPNNLNKEVQKMVTDCAGFLPRKYVAETRELLKKTKKFDNGSFPTDQMIVNVKLGRSINIDIAIALRTVSERYKKSVQRLKVPNLK